MGDNFNSYARYYDLLYKDKDYYREANYIAKYIKKYAPDAKTILDIGCGTGVHAEYFAKMGFTVHGVDNSKLMLKQAKNRKALVPTAISNRLSYSIGDIRTIELSCKFDIVVSLFHVISYQTSIIDLKSSFNAVASHLNENGLFMYDFWYGPSVLLQKPEIRIKRFEDGAISVTRIAEPVMHHKGNIVDVNYHVFIKDKEKGEIEEIQEKHRMRYFFLPELTELNESNFNEIKCCGWMKDDQLSTNDWGALHILKASKKSPK
jgi:SAM-dependent methyltransferase